MKFVYYGRTSPLINLQVEQLLQKAVDFAVKFLELEETSNFNPKLFCIRVSNHNVTQHTWGATHILGNRRVHVNVNNGVDGIRETVLTLFHEIYHVKQISSGELTSSPNGYRVYKGVTYPDNDYTDPYEIEARRVADILFKLFKMGDES